MSAYAVTITKASGERELWDEEKLRRSLRAARATESMIDEIIRHVEKDLRDGISTHAIYTHAFQLLKDHSRPVAAQYSLKKAIMQLGPSGFPFEKFIAEILKAQGFHTQVGVIVQGKCVEHEVDVIAEKSGERILVEAKYHNSSETKSDVKVALYVHARFQDIHKRLEESAAGIGFFTRAWLITNTSFTSQAIQYATCADLALTGWNYPKGRTLQDIIQETQTHPITSLTTLSTNQKTVLLQSGVVLCNDILDNPEPLIAIGIGKSHISTVIEEGRQLCPVNRNPSPEPISQDGSKGV
jgi:Holliday junction resolvase-like predicted endonuclease